MIFKIYVHYLCISSPKFFLIFFMWWYECMKHLWYDFLYNSMYSWNIYLITQLIPLDTPNVMKWNYAWNTNGEKFWSCMVGYNLTNWYHHDMKHLWFAMMYAILVLSNYDVMYYIWCKSWFKILWVVAKMMYYKYWFNVLYHDQHVDKCLKILMFQYHVWYAY